MWECRSGKGTGCVAGEQGELALGSTAADSLSVDEVHELGAGQSSCAVDLLIGLLDKAAHHLLYPEEGRERSKYRCRE